MKQMVSLIVGFALFCTLSISAQAAVVATNGAGTARAEVAAVLSIF